MKRKLLKPSLAFVALIVIACSASAQINNGGGGGGGSGTVGNCAAAGNAYYSASGTTTSCDTSLTDNGAGALTSAQGTITTSAPVLSHTATWNASGVAFTNWLSNITCTAAATASIAAGLGTAGTQWQFKYGAANCASPQLLSPSGSVTNPAYSFSASTNTGIYYNGTTLLGFLINGTLGGFVNASGINANGNGIAGFTSLSSNTNCGAVGTAASPSVASCAGSIAGSFSCATNASGATCVVNTTGVTANSEIFITQRTDTTTGTRLGVTCNTTIDTVQRAVTAVTAGTSFTINLGTITTNPECFSYSIVN